MLSCHPALLRTQPKISMLIEKQAVCLRQPAVTRTTKAPSAKCISGDFRRCCFSQHTLGKALTGWSGILKKLQQSPIDSFNASRCRFSMRQRICTERLKCVVPADSYVQHRFIVCFFILHLPSAFQTSLLLSFCLCNMCLSAADGNELMTIQYISPL